MAMHHDKQHLISLASTVVSVVLALMFPFASNADEEKSAAAPAPSAEKYEVALKSLRPETGPIRMMGIQNNAQVSFPVSARQRLSDVELALFVTNSIALNERSHMAIAINGAVIGQIPFRAQQPETRARITIPAELIKTGYNQISFNVAQHSLESCEDYSSPELWSEIDTIRSTISYNVTPQAIKPSLAELPLLMDKRLVGHYNITIATAGKIDDNMVEAGGLVAQAAALSRDYASLGIRHAKLPVPAGGLKMKSIAALPADLFDGGDGVLLGSRDALAPWLDKETYAQATEPLLAIFPMGEKQERFVLVVTGVDNAQARLAAQTLAQTYSTLPPTAKANIREMTTAAHGSRPTLQPGIRYAFSDLDFHTETRKGITPEEMAIRFWVPADHFAYPNSKLNLSLHMAYGAGFGEQSVLNVFLNNHFEHAVRLAEPRGAVFYDYRVPIPISSLVPGWNVLHFRPSLIPQRAEGRCQPIYTENLLLTLFDDSSMESAETMQLTQLPDLALLGRTGFPFAGGRDNAPVQLALTGHESGTLEAAWTLIGKLAQVNNAPIIGMRSVAPEKADGNTLVVGQLDKVPASLLKHSSIHRPDWWQLGRSVPPGSGMLERIRGNEVNDTSPALMVSIGKWVDHTIKGGWLQFGTAQATPDDAAEKRPNGSKLSLKGSLGNLLDHSVLITQFESPRQRGQSVVMVVANSSELLSRQVATLVDAPYWGQLIGGTVVLGRDSETVRNYVSPQTYLVGSAGFRARLSHSVIRNPVLAIASFAAGIVLFSLLTWRLLVVYRRRQHGVRVG